MEALKNYEDSLRKFFYSISEQANLAGDKRSSRKMKILSQNNPGDDTYGDAKRNEAKSIVDSLPEEDSSIESLLFRITLWNDYIRRLIYDESLDADELRRGAKTLRSCATRLKAEKLNAEQAELQYKEIDRIKRFIKRLRTIKEKEMCLEFHNILEILDAGT